MKLKKCRHGEEEACEKCAKQGTRKCTVKPVLADATVLSSPFLEQYETALAIDFIQQHRQTHSIYATDLIWGEVLARALKEKKALDGFFKTICEYQDIQKKYISFDSDDFTEILGLLNDERALRCKTNDRIHITVSIFEGIEFATFDGGIIDAEQTIKDILADSGYSDEYKFRLFNFKKQKIVKKRKR